MVVAGGRHARSGHLSRAAARASGRRRSRARRRRREKCSALVPSPPGRFWTASASTPANSGTRDSAMPIVTPLARAISVACPARPNPVMSVHAWTAPGGSRVQRLGRRAVQRAHRRDRLVHHRRRRALELDRGADDAGADRLGEEQHVARPARRRSCSMRVGSIAPVTAYPNLISGSCTVWPPSSATPASRSLSKPPRKMSRIVCRFESVFRHRGDRQRGERAAAHRVDVADRVGRGNLAVDVRVVDDRREEVDRLHERRPPLPPEHTRIVRGPEVDEDAVVGVRRDVTQHLSELACGEFARSTGAGDDLRKSLGHDVAPFSGWDLGFGTRALRSARQA